LSVAACPPSRFQTIAFGSGLRDQQRTCTCSDASSPLSLALPSPSLSLPLPLAGTQVTFSCGGREDLCVSCGNLLPWDSCAPGADAVPRKVLAALFGRADSELDVRPGPTRRTWGARPSSRILSRNAKSSALLFVQSMLPCGGVVPADPRVPGRVDTTEGFKQGCKQAGSLRDFGSLRFLRSRCFV